MLRVVDERARERDLRALALREPLRFAVRDRAELEPLDQRVDARGERLFGEAVQAAVVLDVLAARELLIEPRAVRQHAEHAARRERGRREIDAADARRAAIGLEHRRQDPQARRLAGAVRPEQPRDAAVRRLEAHAVERANRAEALAEAFDLDHGAGPSKLKKNGVGGSSSRQLASRSAGAGVSRNARKMRGTQPTPTRPWPWPRPTRCTLFASPPAFTRSAYAGGVIGIVLARQEQHGRVADDGRLEVRIDRADGPARADLAERVHDRSAEIRGVEAARRSRRDVRHVLRAGHGVAHRKAQRLRQLAQQRARLARERRVVAGVRFADQHRQQGDGRRAVAHEAHERAQLERADRRRVASRRPRRRRGARAPRRTAAATPRTARRTARRPRSARRSARARAAPRARRRARARAAAARRRRARARARARGTAAGSAARRACRTTRRRRSTSRCRAPTRTRSRSRTATEVV